jgi:carbamoyltransferase
LIILGLSFDYHDAAAALLRDGRIVAAAQQERFSRRKNDAGLPIDAARFCLSEGGLTAADLDAVVFYEQPVIKFDRIVSSTSTAGASGAAYLDKALRQWLRVGKFGAADRIADALRVDVDRVQCVAHHDTHLASTFFASPFEEACVVSLDGVGEYDTGVIAHGRGTTLTRLTEIHFPHSIGLFYSAMTAFLGFEVNEGEYKVMGMAAYGEPVMIDEMRVLFELGDDGGFALDTSWFNFATPESHPFTDRLIAWLGAPRRPESPFFADFAQGNLTDEGKRYADIAASVQRCVEEVILHTVRAGIRQTGCRHVCLAGGVALNSLTNGRIRRELGVDLYVQPAAGDAGGAIGAAALWHHVNGGARMSPMRQPYWGRQFDPQAIDNALRGSEDMLKIESFPDEPSLLTRVAGELQKGAVIGWLQGRSEWGPRALGNRSILASPLGRHMQAVVNEKIKFRETFRPFAPSVPAEVAHRYFEVPELEDPACVEAFMLAVHPVRSEMRDVLPATTHADGSARVHAVFEESNPRFHRLLHAFGESTGVPVLLDTSFNLRGEPIVDSPEDALRTFWNSAMDFLVLGTTMVQKRIRL